MAGREEYLIFSCGFFFCGCSGFFFAPADAATAAIVVMRESFCCSGSERVESFCRDTLFACVYMCIDARSVCSVVARDSLFPDTLGLVVD